MYNVCMYIMYMRVHSANFPQLAAVAAVLEGRRHQGVQSNMIFEAYSVLSRCLITVETYLHVDTYTLCICLVFRYNK